MTLFRALSIQVLPRNPIILTLNLRHSLPLFPSLSRDLIGRARAISSYPEISNSKIDNARVTVANSVEMQASTVGNDNEMGENSDQGMVEEDEDHKINQDSAHWDNLPIAVPVGSEIPLYEPYVGQEFDSESAAHVFCNTYATRVGFIIRVSKLSRSRHDGSPIGRQLVCNKEGYRLPSKREKIVRQRAETRIGCRAMILVRGKWVITKFVKEHNHLLTPGKGRRDCIFYQYPNEHDKIRELSQQLALEKKRSATYKRHLDLLFEQIEQHNESLTRKIQHIMNNVREIEYQEHNHNGT